MADNGRPQTQTLQRHYSSRGLFAPEIADLILPPLKVGAMTGTAGILAGVGGSIVKETNPIVWGAISGFQWFTLGTSFWFTRSITINAWGGEDRMSKFDKTKVSAFSGTVAGAMAGLIRGPSNIVPAMFVWTLFGAGGQIVANSFAARQPKVKKENDEGFWAKWSPLKKLSDEEYINMMSEKVLRVEADIALIDDRIAELRQKCKEESLDEFPSKS